MDNQKSALDANKIFIITGYHEESSNKVIDSKPQTYYVVADSSYEAVQAVTDKINSFLPVGSSTLAELKRIVLEMEAIRIGIRKPLNQND